ncbi:MAG: putative porin, partial [Deltaproteobacteria bacterium]|nr:putative porin [Deltaproteobacteria bacterium]
GDLTDTASFIGYNHKHSQQMIFDSDEKLLNEFGCWELGAKLKIKDVLPVPISLFGSYVKNQEADIDELMEKGVDPGDSDPAKLEKYSGDDRDSGWLVGLSVGNKKKKGNWYAKYHYQELEDYAFPAVFVDSDFHGGGSNNKGHYVQGRYFIRDNIQARATGFFTKREDESKDGKKDEDRIQLDIVIAF